MKKEIWKDIEEYEGLYQISNFGNVKNKKNKKIKEATHYHGYKYVMLSKNKKQKKKYIHRLVAQAFIENPNNYKEVNHKDGNKENNYIDNLEWCTRSYNVLHSYKNHLLVAKKGKNNSMSKPVVQYTNDGIFIKKWDCINDVFRALKIRDICISRCCRGLQKTAGGFKWKYLKNVK